jgi:peptidoglycan/xylan/chitin deacetylase (PgdA/CDA1 family)
MRILLAVSLLSTSVFAHIQSTDTSITKEKFDYANIYVDSLIERFDKRLDEKLILNDTKSILIEATYSKLLSGRSYIESYKGNSNKSTSKSFSILNIQNSKIYNDVVNSINNNAVNIQRINTKRFSRQKVDSVIFPSITKSGNLTGNTFPKKVWSLTFDDGPRGIRTKTIVDALYDRGLKATFFMLTEEAIKYKSTAQYVVDSGMNVALHSYTHPNLVKATSKSLDYEITTAKKDLENLLNIKTSVFRLPYGSGMRSTEIRKKIVENNYVHIFWNVDTLDWKDKDPKSILERTKKQMKLSRNDAGIILYHDIHKQSVIASEMTMDHLIENDYSVCTVEDVISYSNGKKVSCIK